MGGLGGWVGWMVGLRMDGNWWIDGLGMDWFLMDGLGMDGSGLGGVDR